MASKSDQAKDKRLQRVYGLTLKQYQKMLKLQKKKCALCGKPQTRTLHVDHDHLTGRVRGLLCYYCNRRVIGRHRVPDLLRKAADYLASDFDGRTI